MLIGVAQGQHPSSVALIHAGFEAAELGIGVAIRHERQVSE
jgi:hypothetical protein